VAAARASMLACAIAPCENSLADCCKGLVQKCAAVLPSRSNGIGSVAEEGRAAHNTYSRILMSLAIQAIHRVYLYPV
jgi:hypothetical protein